MAAFRIWQYGSEGPASRVRRLPSDTVRAMADFINTLRFGSPSPIPPWDPYMKRPDRLSPGKTQKPKGTFNRAAFVLRRREKNTGRPGCQTGFFGKMIRAPGGSPRHANDAWNMGGMGYKSSFLS
jgi:hypothetical protein